MQRVNIAVDTAFMSNFLVLGRSFITSILGEDVKVNLISPQGLTADINNGEVNKSFDLLVITNFTSIHERTRELILPHEKIEINRLSKPAQYALMKNFYEKQRHKPKNFYLPSIRYSTYHEHHNQYGIESDFDEPKDVIIKPLHGARGIGQIFFSKERTFSLVSFMKEFKAQRNPRQVYSLIQDYKIRHGADNIRFELGDKKHNACITSDASVDNDVLEDYQHNQNEIENDEGLKLLLEAFYIQEYVPVHVEFRLLTDHDGDIAYVQQRDLVTRHFPQATGSNGDEFNNQHAMDKFWLKGCLGKEYSFLEKLAKKVVGPLNSLDVFVTVDGQWGVFEYCNQFGIEGVPKPFAYKLHEEFIKNFIIKSGILSE